MGDRAVVFIDGNNWFHSLKNLGVADRGRLNYGKISKKLMLRHLLPAADLIENGTASFIWGIETGSLGHRRLDPLSGMWHAPPGSKHQVCRTVADKPIRVKSRILNTLFAPGHCGLARLSTWP